MTGLVRLATALTLAVALGGACATPRGASSALPDLRPGERPAADSDEAGLWMMADRLERTLQTSGALVTDPVLNGYLRAVVCRLVPEHCAGIRIYVVQTPYFNASMAPNGMMQIWTGLLLRAENEAQLAFILGHEIGHYERRHTVQLWRDLRTKGNIAMVFSVLTAGAGVGPLGLLGQLAALGSVLKFSRDAEREADDIGFEMMARAGYDQREAGRIWEALEEERKAAGTARPFVFFATHPPEDERVETLRKLASKGTSMATTLGREGFLDVTLLHRAEWLRDELRLREFKGSQVVLDHLRAGGVRLGEVYYFQGELYRLRVEKDDEPKAIAAYEQALAAGDAPTETYRTLGLLWMKSGERARARGALQHYLDARPDAADGEIVRAYLSELQ